jgi:HK97 family phage major capsid protein
MSEPYFDEEASIALLLRWRDSDDFRALDTLLQEHLEPLVRRLIYTRQSQKYEDVDELTSACLRRLASRLSRFDVARGKLYSWCTKMCERAIIDVIRRKRTTADRFCSIDDVLANTLCTNGEEHTQEVLADILHKLSQVQTVFTKENELRAQRWLLRNLVDSNFRFYRWQASDSMTVVFGIAPRRARHIYDLTILAARRALLDERKLGPVNVYRLCGTRQRALTKYRPRLSNGDFARLVHLMVGLAPAIIETGEYALHEILYGAPKKERALFSPGESLTSEDMSQPHYAHSAPVGFTVEPVENPFTARTLEVESQGMPAAVVPPSRRSVIVTEPPKTRVSQTPNSLLAAESQSDFAANLRELERQSGRPYSLLRCIREMMAEGGPKSVLELECSLELKNFTGIVPPPGGALIPMEVLNHRRDLDTGTGGAFVPTVVEREIVPYLRNKSVCGRMGATILEGLPPGSHSLPRATGTAGATWLSEIAVAAPTNPLFDTVLLQPQRIEAQVQISRQLIRQSAPPIEAFVIREIQEAISVAVDQAALNGAGAPSPTGILQVGANPTATYAYGLRSPDVSGCASAPSWSKILEFSANLEAARVDLAECGFVVSPDVRNLLQSTPVVATFPRYLWEPGLNGFGSINGMKSLSSYNMPATSMLCARWSDMLIAQWQGIQLLIDPYSLASQSLVRISVSLLATVGFRYAVAFCASVN